MTLHIYLPFRGDLEWRGEHTMPPKALENPQPGAFWSEVFDDWRTLGGRFVAPQ